MPRSIRLLVLVVITTAACTADLPSDPPYDAVQFSTAHQSAAHDPAAETSPELNKHLAELRRATAQFHDYDSAVGAGYTARITSCWESRSLGAMGYHQADPSLIDGTVELLRPEALMYEPGPGGEMRLVGMEYIVPIDAWQGGSEPRLLGESFHRHSVLPIYKLHVWLWRVNPRGTFADWNPKVSCQFAAEREYFQ
jgi:hypothetical protein